MGRLTLEAGNWYTVDGGVFLCVRVITSCVVEGFLNGSRKKLIRECENAVPIIDHSAKASDLISNYLRSPACGSFFLSIIVLLSLLSLL